MKFCPSRGLVTPYNAQNSLSGPEGAELMQHARVTPSSPVAAEVAWGPEARWNLGACDLIEAAIHAGEGRLGQGGTLPSAQRHQELLRGRTLCHVCVLVLHSLDVVLHLVCVHDLLQQLCGDTLRCVLECPWKHLNLCITGTLEPQVMEYTCG